MKLRRVLGWIALAIPLAAILALAVGYWLSDNDCGKAAVPRVPTKAITYCDYGTADVLRLEDVEKPVPGDNELLVRVHAAGVNPLDWHYMRGQPYFMRLFSGIGKPKVERFGVDFAGTVEAVGADVTLFRVGDPVFGGRSGALAEYVAVRADRALALKPENITFAEAAAVPVAAITALQALRDKGAVRPGQKVLVNGASGGVGTFAVQIAKTFGAEVTGVTSTGNVDLVRAIGADHVIDYTRDDFTKGTARYDLILDNVGNHSMAQTRRVLTPTGMLISNGGGHVGGKLGRTLRTMLVSMVVRQQARPSVKTQNHYDLVALKELVEAGHITPVIDGTYPLGETPKAIARVASGRARGTIVIAVLAGARPAVGSDDTQPQVGSRTPAMEDSVRQAVAS